MEEPLKCPKCGEMCDRDEVDIGVGIQYGPWGCNYCGWAEGDITLKDLKDQFKKGG